MDAARLEQVRVVFEDVSEREPAERAAHLDAVCGGDDELRGAVLTLLRAHDRAAGFLDPQRDPDLRALVAEAFDEAEPAPLPSSIGPYRVVRELGRGGMGTVYLAERDDPGLRKTVAVKVVRPSVDPRFVLRRFRLERQILAGLEHPGIARLYDGGTTAEGLPYFVMEYVDGRNLLEYCDAHRLPIPERLSLFRRVCSAVQFAHQRLVVHCDLKPSNILVTAEGEPRLLDFGIAKLLSPPLEGDAEDTATFARPLSPQYASPEQVRGEPVTTASDVYSLGVILYELLSGHRPYRVKGRSLTDIERAMLADEPAPPSAAVFHPPAGTDADGDPAAAITPEAVSSRRATTPEKLRRSLRSDLDNIVRKALRLAPADRYATAADLVDDVTRHLDGYPVRARPDSTAYRAAKFVRRHRTGIGAAMAAALSLLAGSGVAIWQARVAVAERDRATRRFDEVRRLTQVLLFDVHDRIRDLAGATPARELLVKTGLEYLDRLAREAADDPSLLSEVAGGYERLGDVQGGLLIPNLGQSGAALASYEKALELRLRLAEARPRDGNALRDLARGQLKIAQALVRLARVAEAPAYSARAVENLERCASSFAGVTEFSREQGDALVSHGYYTAATGEFEKGLVSIRQAAQILEPLQASQPTDAILGRSYGLALFRLSQILEELPEGRGIDEAIGVSLRAVELSRRLTADRPAEMSLRRGLETALGRAGTLSTARGRHQEALGHLLEAKALLEEDVRADPSDVLARRNLGVCCTRIARSLTALGRAGEARQTLEPARERLAALLAKDPENVTLKVTMGEAETRMGEALLAVAQRGSHAAHERRRLVVAARVHFERAIAILGPLVERRVLVGSDAVVLEQARTGLLASLETAAGSRSSSRR